MIRVLLHDAAAPSPITPEYLSRFVAPYLSALAILQTVADIIHNRTEPLEIQQITTENGRVVACLMGGSEVIHFAERAIPAWRRRHDEHLRAMRELDEMLAWLTDGATQESVLLEREDLRLRLQPDLLRLVLDFLGAVSPDAPQLGQVMYIDKLLAAFQLLVFSAITLAVLNS